MSGSNNFAEPRRTAEPTWTGAAQPVSPALAGRHWRRWTRQLFAGLCHPPTSSRGAASPPWLMTTATTARLTATATLSDNTTKGVKSKGTWARGGFRRHVDLVHAGIEEERDRFDRSGPRPDQRRPGVAACWMSRSSVAFRAPAGSSQIATRRRDSRGDETVNVIAALRHSHK